MNVVEEPTHAYGKKILFKPHHSADIARLILLSHYGGIYLGNNYLHIFPDIFLPS